MRRAVKIVFGVSSVALGVCLLVFLLPHTLGVGWATTAQQIAALSGFNVMCLAVVWLAYTSAKIAVTLPFSRRAA